MEPVSGGHKSRGATTRRQLAAVMLADIVGYSRMLERNESDFIEKFRTARESVIGPAISQHGGSIARMAGDGVLATFSSIVGAVESAVQIQSGMAGLNREDDAEPNIVFRIGVHFGDIVIEEGNLHGEGINLAARLESMALPETILTTEQVAEQVNGKIAARLHFLRTQQVKNIERPVRIYEVIWQGQEVASAQVGSPAHRDPPPRTSAVLCGREEQLARMAVVLSHSAAGQSHLVLLAGEAGIGKTRLADAIAHLALDHQMLVFSGLCREDSGVPAYWPWRQILSELRRRFGHSMEDTPPELGELLGNDENAGRFHSSTVEGSNSGQARFRLFHQVTDYLKRVSESYPLLLSLDDLHRADTPSLKLLEFVASEVANSSICILGTYRDSDVTTGHRFEETLSELARLNRYEHIKLGNLAQSEVALLSKEELGEEMDPALGERIFERTGGHPLYLLETIRHLHNGGDSSVLPPTLRAIINQRIGTLSAEALLVLNGAAVLGRRFDLASLASVLDKDIGAIVEVLDEPLRANQIEAMDKPGEFRFTHALIREAIYDNLPGADRLLLHRNVAIYLEDEEAEPAEIAFHYHRAAPLGFAEKATEFSKRAAQQATRMMAYEEAVRTYQQALTVAKSKERAALTLALGSAQLAAGDSIQAASTFDRAAELAHAKDNFSMFLDAAIRLEESLFRPGLPAQLAVRRLQAAHDWEGATVSSQQRVQLLCALGRAHAMSGEAHLLWPLQARATEIARDSGDPHLLLRCLLTAGSSAIGNIMQHVDVSSAAAREAVELARTMPNPKLRVEVLSHAIPVFLIKEDQTGIDADLNEHGSIADTLKEPFYVYENNTLRAGLALARGDLESSEAFACAALKMANWLPGQDVEGVYGIHMFHLRREQARLRELAPVVEFFVRSNPQSAVWRPGLALVYAELGELTKCRALLDAMLREKFTAVPQDALWAATISYLCEASALIGHVEAGKVLYEIVQPYEQFNFTLPPVVMLGSAARYLGQLAAISENWVAAEVHFELAISSNERQGFETWAAHCRLDLAQMLLHRNQPNDRARAMELCETALTHCSGRGLVAIELKSRALKTQLSSSGETGDTLREALSKRELQVLSLIAQGKDNKEIGKKLFISPNTVAAHVRNILAKTDTSNRTEAAAFASQNKLLDEIQRAK